MAKQSKKLLDQVRDTIRRKHYAIRTEESYVNWIRRFILYHDKRHPREMGASEVEAYLTYLAYGNTFSQRLVYPSIRAPV